LGGGESLFEVAWDPYQDRTVKAGMAISRGLSGGGGGFFL